MPGMGHVGHPMSHHDHNDWFRWTILCTDSGIAHAKFSNCNLFVLRTGDAHAAFDGVQHDITALINSFKLNLKLTRMPIL